MWFLPLLVVGAIAAALVGRSKRPPAPPSRQLAAPPPPELLPAGAFPTRAPVGPPGVPGPISVLGEVLRIGQTPSPTVILCAIAEAQSIGRNDLASDIVRVFIAPVVYHHQRMRARGTRPVAVPYERGTCAPVRSPRELANESCQRPFQSPFVPSPFAPPAPASQAAAQPKTSAPNGAPVPSGTPAAAASLDMPHDMDEEIRDLLNADPARFMEMVSRSGTIPRAARAPEAVPVPPTPSPTLSAVAMPSPMATAPAPMHVVAPSQVAAPMANADVLAEQLIGLPGFSQAGVVLVDPSTRAEVFEVRWLRGYSIPQLPQVIDGRPVRLAIVDALATAQPTGLPPETVAQMQEAAGLPQAADQTRAMAPGSPLPRVPDAAWRDFVARLARESPQFASSRHVGQYRQRRERLADLGIDPAAIANSAQAQRAALDADLVDAHRHGLAGELFSQHLGRPVSIPGREGVVMITLSGVLGVIQCAGLDGAVGWLERSNDRKRYPHTTQAFLSTNGVF